MEVLSQALAEKIEGRKVKVALFTTFTFDPGFFERLSKQVLVENKGQWQKGNRDWF